MTNHYGIIFTWCTNITAIVIIMYTKNYLNDGDCYKKCAKLPLYCFSVVVLSMLIQSVVFLAQNNIYT